MGSQQNQQVKLIPRHIRLRKANSLAEFREALIEYCKVNRMPKIKQTDYGELPSVEFAVVYRNGYNDFIDKLLTNIEIDIKE